MTDDVLDQKFLFDIMPIPRFIVKALEDNRFVVVDINERALEYFGQNAESVIGHSIDDFMDGDSSRYFIQSFEVCVSKQTPVTILALPKVPGGIRVNGFWVTPIDIGDKDVQYLDVRKVEAGFPA